MYYKSIYYAIFLVVFGVLGYLFLDSGFNTKTRVRVDYQDNSEVFYNVNYLNNEYTSDGDKFVSNMVDTINISYNYNNILSEYVGGFYRYSVDAYLIAYEDNIVEDLWKKQYNLISEKTEVIAEENVNNIKIDDSFVINFREYRDEIYNFINNYGIDVSGYINVRINILEHLKFDSLDNEYADNKVITINIPVTKDTFKINVNNINERDSYYEFSDNVTMNIVFLIIGAFCLSASVSLGILVIRQFKIIYCNQTRYQMELKRILSKYDDCIVRVKRFYVNRKYNMIYVDSFSEFMDVYEKKNKMISFKEIKRGSESIFVIIDGDDAWIYKLIADKL